MALVLDRILVIAVLGGLLAWIAWGWSSWFRAPRVFNFGIVCSLVGFALASLSASLEIVTGIYGQFAGGIPFMDPNLLRVYGIGLLTSAIGFFCSLLGGDTKSPVRWKALTLSAVMLLLWFIQAVGE